MVHLPQQQQPQKQLQRRQQQQQRRDVYSPKAVSQILREREYEKLSSAAQSVRGSCGRRATGVYYVKGDNIMKRELSHFLPSFAPLTPPFSSEPESTFSDGREFGKPIGYVTRALLWPTACEKRESRSPKEKTFFSHVLPNC